MTWLLANWQSVAIGILAIDAALIPIFPNVGILKTLKTLLTDVTPKQP